MPYDQASGLRRIWRVVRRHGVSEIWWRLLHRLRLVSVHHALTIWGYELGQERPAEKPANPAWRGKMVLREVTATELTRLRLAVGLGTHEEHQQRMSRGSRLFAAVLEDLIVSVDFIHPKVAELSYLNHPALPLLDERAFYLHGGATAEDNRRQGIGSALRMFLLRTLKAEGYRLGILATFFENEVAELYHRSSGFQPWARVTWLRWRNRDIWHTRLTAVGQNLPLVLRFNP